MKITSILRSIVLVGPAMLSSALYASETGQAILDGQVVTYENVDGWAIYQGDIILGTVEEIEASWDDQVAGAVVIDGDNHRWQDGIIPYELDSNLPSSTITRIQLAISHWHDNTSINLVQRTSGNASQYPDYVTFTGASGVCNASVGRRGGEQFIRLSTGCSSGAVIHEIGHAAGLWHEQSREDRDDWVDILDENIEPGKEHNFDNVDNGNDYGPYDYGSIMHYGRSAFSANGSPTIVPINPSTATIGQRAGLSEGDAIAVELIHQNGRAFSTTTGKCLDVHGPDLSNFVNGAKVQGWGCYETSKNQAWRMSSEGSIVASNGKCLDVHSPDFDSAVDGGKVQLWSCIRNNANQQWSLTSSGEIKSANGLCLDIPDLQQNGGEVRLWTCDGSPEQKWVSQSQGRKIQNFWQPNTYLHIENGTIEAGQISQAWQSAAWFFEEAPGGFVRIKNRWQQSERLHIENGVLESGSASDGWLSAQWKLIEIPSSQVSSELAGRVYQIQNRWQPDQYLHIENGVIESGPIQPNWSSARWVIDRL